MLQKLSSTILDISTLYTLQFVFFNSLDFFRIGYLSQRNFSRTPIPYLQSEVPCIQSMSQIFYDGEERGKTKANGDLLFKLNPMSSLRLELNL